MPHLDLFMNYDVSSKVQVDGLLRKLHFTLSEQETIDLEQVKSRVFISDFEYIGDIEKTPQNFVHCQVKLMPGRPDDLRKTISTSLHDVIVESLKEFQVKSYNTVEVIELDKEAYTASKDYE